MDRERQRIFQGIPTNQSIEAQSEVSVDLRQNQLEPLISKIFILCIELEKKDIEIENLKSEVKRDEMKKSQIDITRKDLESRYSKLEQEHHLLIGNKAILENRIIQLERINADLEHHKERSGFNRELQDRAYHLESKLKIVEEHKIEYEAKIENLKRENSILTFQTNKTQQKNRIKDLQGQVLQEKQKLEVERRQKTELSFRLQRAQSEIKQIKEAFQIKMQTYQQKIINIEKVKDQEVLKQSRCTADNEQRLVLLSQQIHRLTEEVQYLRTMLKEQKAKFTDKQQENNKLMSQIKAFEEVIKDTKIINENRLQDYAKKEQMLNNQIENLEKGIRNEKTTQSDMHFYLNQKALKQQQLEKEIQRLQNQVQQQENQNSNLKSQIRKLKRKTHQNTYTQCEVCKVRTSISIIPSNQNILDKLKPMDLQDIIRETQKLSASNRKIQSLINHQEIISQSAIEFRNNTTHTINISDTK